MKNKLKKIILCITLCLFTLTAVGCSSTLLDFAVKQGLDPSIETPTTFPTNGVDGKDGKDGDSIDLYEVYSKLVELKEYNGTFDEFVKEYLGIEDSAYSVNTVLTSVVSVYSGFTSEITYQTSPTTTETFIQKGYGAGAGVIIRLDKGAGDALVLTNYHVVYDNSSSPQISNDISLFLYGQEIFSVNTTDTLNTNLSTYKHQELTSDYKISATYLGGSMKYDLAVLKVSNSEILKNSCAKAVKFADSNDISVGETAIAIGNPSAYGISATKGIVSVDSEYIQMTGVDGITPCEFRVLRTDAPINSGNSGGGLFNKEGELIGIVNAKLSSSTIENIAYAIPSNVARYVSENIIRNCDGNTRTTVKRCLLGIGVKALSSSAVNGYKNGELRTEIVEKIAIGSITEGSIADGLFDINDVLTRVKINYTNGEVVEQNLTRTFHLVDLSLTLSIGDKLTLYRTDINGNEKPFVEVIFTANDVSEFA